MKKFCVLFSLLMSTMVFTACGAGIKYSSDSNSSNSSGSKQTKNAELVDLGSDPQAYMLYGTYRNEENYKDEDGSYANEHADDYDYMTLQLEDSEKYEVQILPIQIYADTDFLIYDLSGKTDKELKEEEGLTDQQIGALHEYWQYNHIRASFVERKKYSEDGEYSYSVNTLFTFAYEVVGDKLYMGLEALIMDGEDETNLGYHVQDRKDWVEYSYGFDGLDLILSKDGKSTRLRSADILYAEKKNEGLYEWGYAKNSSSGYDGIVHLSLNTEDGDDSYIEWADGRTGENVKTQIDGNQFTLTWDSTYRYDYDLGESEEGEGGKITGIFLITNRPNGGMDGGLSICVDGKWYPYVYDSTAYWNGELSDNLETDADVSSMSEDELGELKENQTSVSSGLMGAFKEQGLDSTKIDESTGTVQMDNNVLFAWDKADLSEEGKAYLDQFLAAYVPVISSAIEDGKVSTIVVEGYTDSAGDEAYNLKLSEERAKTVADYIKAGYPELTNAIEVVGNGANNLILDGEGKEDAAASRRVEVRYVLKTE
ncbi:MAG: OmpA family protein [Coprococcus comes]